MRSNAIRKTHLERVSKVISENVLREASESGESAQFNQLVLPLVKKVYPDMLTSQICDIQPIQSPFGRIAALFSYYKPDSTVALDNCRIITVTGPGFAVGDPVTSDTGGAGDVVYSEGSAMLIKVSAGTFVPGGTLSGPGPFGYPIVHSSINRTTMKKVLTNYSWAALEYDSPREVASTIRTMTVEAETRKLKTTLTLEQLQDYEKLYGIDAYDLVSEILKNEIQQEIDMEVIGYMKEIATPIADVVAANSLAMTSGDMLGVSNDLYANLFLCGEEIVKATKRNRTMFVMADVVTMGLLLMNPLHASIEGEQNDNPFHVGKIGVYDLYCDIYSDDHYCLIGYHGSGAGDGDTGLIYAPYINEIVTAQDPETFSKKFMMINRAAIARHPQDQGNGTGDSDFFRIFAVDLTGLPNYNI